MNKIKKYFPYRYGLTGTPNANTIADIWHQVFIIDDGKRLGHFVLPLPSPGVRA
jgi:hypothetical protein